MDLINFIQQQPWCTSGWSAPSISDGSKILFQECKDLSEPKVTDDIVHLIAKSKEFPIKFPIETIRLHELKKYRPAEELKNNIASTYPLLHTRVLALIADFISYKRNFGSKVEQELYKDMTVSQFIDRILKKRALEFIGAKDKYRLITGEKGSEGWESIGTDEQQPPLTLDRCLSYDELKISALVYVSGYTSCINDGNRQNRGVRNEEGVETNAVIIGLIGPRLKRKFRMDYEDLEISVDQNTRDNGYGGVEASTPTTTCYEKKLKTTHLTSEQSSKSMWRKLWADFYQVPSYTYNTVLDKVKHRKKDHPTYKEKFVPLSSTAKNIFDNETYYKRIRVMAECTLYEANSRAEQAKKAAYLNVIGCGLGVWMISKHQQDVYLLTFIHTINSLLLEGALQHVSDVNFAYIMPTDSAILDYLTQPSSEEMKVFLKNSAHPKGGISITLISRQPSSKLTGEHEGKLLVLTYPWDSNAHPGNEFWHGNLKGSGDPAAASSTQVAELHNAHINPNVVGDNARVAGTLGVKRLNEYCRKFSQ